MRVADFFCGAGGFSEGFRQKGFKVAFALDNWKPAIDTHELNHPGAKHALLDILSLDTIEKIESVVPDTEVIIGSPPCVSFSGSNRAGKADKTLGVKLIEAYLRIVLVKKAKGVLKYWLLENVPNSSKYIKDKYSWAELGLAGKGPDLIIPKRGFYAAADYGAPQTRLRFICGDFIEPQQTHSRHAELVTLEGRRFKKWISLSEVLSKLGEPLGKTREKIEDPVYGFKISSKKLSDHYYDTRVPDFEWKSAKQLKEDHGYMGKMSFPEDLTRPSRTVMATLSSSTRESMLFSSYDSDGKKNGIRSPTIREVATFMSFPITYQFEAKNESSKYRLVGNAVCSRLSGAFAEAIAKKTHIKIPQKFLALPSNKPAFDLNGMSRQMRIQRNRKPDAKSTMHIPYLKISSLRVSLENTRSNFDKGRIRWDCVLHAGSGKGAKSLQVDFTLLEKMCSGRKEFSLMIGDLRKELHHVMTPQSLQINYTNNFKFSPAHVLDIMKKIVDKRFPPGLFDKAYSEGLPRPISAIRRSIPTRILAGLYICSYFVQTLEAEETTGDSRKLEKVYLPPV